MASCMRRCGLAFVIAALWLVGASGEALTSSRAVIQGADLTRSVQASTEPLASDSDSSIACFDIATEGANITHIFVNSPCATSPSDFAITVDGEPVTELHTAVQRAPRCMPRPGVPASPVPSRRQMALRP